MRLRYLRLHNLPPLDDIEIVFGHEPVLSRTCAIRFVVGVNGSGKSRLLQALADIFLNLERQRLPAMPVTLAYDLTYVTNDSQSETSKPTTSTVRTIYLHHPGETPADTMLIEFAAQLPSETQWEDLETIDWEQLPYRIRNHYRGDSLPGSGTIATYLPGIILAYTSGATSAWETLFTPPADAPDFLLEKVDSDQERPVYWDIAKELEKQRLEEGSSIESPKEDSFSQQTQRSDTTRIPSIGMLVRPEELKLAVCAVTLEQAIHDFRTIALTHQDEETFVQEITEKLLDRVRMSGLRGLLNVIDWLWPITINLQIVLNPENLTRPQATLLHNLYEIATTVIREPGSDERRTLIFDLRRLLPERDTPDTSTAAALFSALGTQELETPHTSAFTMFRHLRNLYHNEILQNVSIILRKRNTNSLLLYDWLSDGEQVFLGRMALFHMLRGAENALVMLDEPETHFNDVWKREIVNIIDNGLRKDPSEVMISTHSSIALTDVFDTEITLLRKDPNDGTVAAVRTPIRSFGASPTEIMTSIFNASESVGQRATEFLDMVLMVAGYPDQVHEVWLLDTQRNGSALTNNDLQQNQAFRDLLGFITELPHDYGDENERRELLIDTLRSIRSYTIGVTGETNVRVADALEALQNRLGAGYYQFEFRRRMRALRERDENAPSDQAP